MTGAPPMPAVQPPLPTTLARVYAAHAADCGEWAKDLAAVDGDRECARDVYEFREWRELKGRLVSPAAARGVNATTGRAGFG